MQKIGRYIVVFLLLSVTLLPYPSSAAQMAQTTTEPAPESNLLPIIHLTPDIQTQIRSNTPVKITKAIDYRSKSATQENMIVNHGYLNHKCLLVLNS